MGDLGFQYSEAFLQWLWGNGLFDHNELRTECGKPVRILDLGTHNKTDGPDFISSRLAIDGVEWHGNVELHLKSRDWYAHGHQKDENYNSVILHVVASGNSDPVETLNGSQPFTLKLEKYLTKSFRVFLKSFQSGKALPCSGNLNFISEEVFYKQLDKAHSEYFEKKTDDFLTFYDPNLLPSEAWKKALILSIWDGLGISHNRQAMRLTGERLLGRWNGKEIGAGIELAIEEAGLRGHSDNDWNLKGVRPANHPQKRIEEAVLMTHEILMTPFEKFLSKDSTEMWEKFCDKLEIIRSSRLDILYGTVFLPALYTLGMLFAHESMKHEVRTIWDDLQTPIPRSLLKKFKALQLKSGNYRKKLGSIHQLKSYCMPGKCSECFVLKNAIQS